MEAPIATEWSDATVTQALTEQPDLPEPSFEDVTTSDHTLNTLSPTTLQSTTVGPHDLQPSLSDNAQGELTVDIIPAASAGSPKPAYVQQLRAMTAEADAPENNAETDYEGGDISGESPDEDIDALFGEPSQPDDLDPLNDNPPEQTEPSNSKDAEFQAWWNSLGPPNDQLVLPVPSAATIDCHTSIEEVDDDCLPNLNQPAPQQVLDGERLELPAEIDASLIDPAIFQDYPGNPALGNNVSAANAMDLDDTSLAHLQAQDGVANISVDHVQSQEPLQASITRRSLPNSPPRSISAEMVSFGPGPLQWYAVEGDEGVRELEGHDDSNSEAGEDDASDNEAEGTPYPAHPRPAAWGPNQSKTPAFKYSTRGQWSVGSYFSTEALRFYESRCPRNLTIWLQANPRSHQRHDEWDRTCRWSECPDKGHPIRPGFYRCTFDEYSHLTTQGKKDPFFVAGCMHLYCFEQVFDVAKLHRRGRLIPDERLFELEGRKNPLKIDRPPDTAIIDSAFYRWLMEKPDTQNIPAHMWTPRPHEQSLSYAMTQFHISRHSPGRLKTQEEHDGTGKVEALPMTAHLGDLRLFLDSVKAQKEYKLTNPTTKVSKPKKATTVSRRNYTSSLTSLDSYDTTEDSDEEMDDAETEVHVIDQILGSRRRDGKTEYEVKWRGHRTTTWEPRASLREDLSSEQIEDLLSGKNTSSRKQADGRIKAIEQQINGLLEVIQMQQKELKTRKRRRDAEADSDYEDEAPAKRKRIIKPTKKKAARKSAPADSDESQDESDGSAHNPRKRKCAPITGSSSNKRRKFVVG